MRTYWGQEPTFYERAEACVNVVTTLRNLTEKAGVDFLRFMEDKWDKFEDAESMIYTQTKDNADLLLLFCEDSETLESQKMKKFAEKVREELEADTTIPWDGLVETSDGLVYSAEVPTFYERAEACVNVADTLRHLTGKAGIDFLKFMEDKWDKFKEAENMICLQADTFDGFITVFCRDSNTPETVQMLEYAKREGILE